MRYPHPTYASISATRQGHVFSSGRRLYGSIDGSGYVQVNVKDIGKLRQAHRLVYECVTGNMLPEYKRGDPKTVTINHKNGLKTVNRFSNLELLSHTENVKHSLTVLGKHHRGCRAGKSELSFEDFTAIVDLLKKGVSNKDIAARFPLDSTNVSRLRNRKSYAPEWERYDKQNVKFVARGPAVSYKKFLRILSAKQQGKLSCWIAGKAGISEGYLSQILNRKTLLNYWKDYDLEQ